MLDNFDVDFIVDDEDFWKEKDESDESVEKKIEPDEENVKTDNLIYDALHHNMIHLEKYDLDHCFEGENPEYFEAVTIAEIVEYLKSIKRKIKAVLIFVSGNMQMSEVQEAVDAIKPYCTAECMNGKFLFGCAEEDIEGVARYRMLLALEQQPQQPQADSQKADELLNAENKKSDEDTPTTSDEEIDALLGGTPAENMQD